MGAMKQCLLEQAEKESEEMEGLCLDCGNILTDEELECGHDFCFDCYLYHND